MSSAHDLLVELAAEVEVAGGLSDAWREDFLGRCAAVYDVLEAGDPDRLWLRLVAGYVSGVLSREQVRDVLGPAFGGRL